MTRADGSFQAWKYVSGRPERARRKWALPFLTFHPASERGDMPSCPKLRLLEFERASHGSATDSSRSRAVESTSALLPAAAARRPALAARPALAVRPTRARPRGSRGAATARLGTPARALTLALILLLFHDLLLLEASTLRAFIPADAPARRPLQRVRTLLKARGRRAWPALECSHASVSEPPTCNRVLRPALG